MKALRLIGASAAAALLLTSCLGESSNTTNRTTFAVGSISEKTFKTILGTPVGPIYSAAVASTVQEGACYQVNFEIDFDSPENANANTNGYYTATIGGLEEVTKGNAAFYNVPDTALLVENEIALTNAGFFAELGAYVDGYLFMGATYNGLKDQKNAWTLYWDRSKEPEKVDGVPTYSLFLRAAKTAEGTGSTATSITDIRAYNIKAVLESVNNAESGKGNEKFNLKINFLNNINEKDNSDLTWKSVTIPFSVVKAS